MTMAMTLYDMLGIPSTASSEEVRKAYKLKALATHPDKLAPNASEQDKRAAEARFRAVHEAFEILSDQTKRKAYDTRMQMAMQNLKRWNEEQAKRTKEREEWARQAKQRSDERMKERASLHESIRRMKTETEVYHEVVDKLYQELCEMNPEWEIRRKNILQRMAEKAMNGHQTRQQRAF